MVAKQGWPTIPVIHAALRGLTAEVVYTVAGRPARGFQNEWLQWTVNKQVTCSRCGCGEEQPEPPRGQGHATGPRVALFGPESREYATYVLVWLHTFTKHHSRCKEYTCVKT